MKTSISKNFIILVIVLITQSIFSQNLEVKVVNLKPLFKENKFPEVQIKDNLKVQNKINTFLQLEHLEHLPNIFKKNPYEKLKIDEDSNMYRTYFYNWSVNNSPKNILSLLIDAEFTGAYSEGFYSYNNFDLRTGNKITINNILTKEGKNSLENVINEKVTLEIKKFIKEIKKITPEDTETKEIIAEQIPMYEDCLTNSKTYSMEYYNFTFLKDSIKFSRGRCSNHAMRALDDLDTFEINLSYKEMEKYLSPYGKSLCLENSKETNSISVEGKMFKGKINNKYPITAIIQEISSDNSTQITYWYDKYNLPIIWSGKFENNQFHLIEENEANQKIIVDIIYTENKIEGFWKNKTTNKTLKLELKEY